MFVHCVPAFATPQQCHALHHCFLPFVPFNSYSSRYSHTHLTPPERTSIEATWATRRSRSDQSVSHRLSDFISVRLVQLCAEYLRASGGALGFPALCAISEIRVSTSAFFPSRCLFTACLPLRHLSSAMHFTTVFSLLFLSIRIHPATLTPT